MSQSLAADHPRIRGEHYLPKEADIFEGGSSPHTRGAQSAWARAKHGMGIIPAYAGSTNLHHYLQETIWDHPRIRGEHPLIGECKASTAGSSPHTRGARQERGAQPGGHRIIPAYAGSTRPPRHRDRPPTDHPRIRGEHYNAHKVALEAGGSSPHTRGAPDGAVPDVPESRIIPAYAGSTALDVQDRLTWRDHPRIRGEHRVVGLVVGEGLGSSPHTRGAHLRRHKGEKAAWIIPAYAGSTFRGTGGNVPYADHPRIRGEHVYPLGQTPRNPGSSPHTRGAPEKTRERSENARIIPAYAGSTVGAIHLHRMLADHPRIRGEHPGIPKAAS